MTTTKTPASATKAKSVTRYVHARKNRLTLTAPAGHVHTFTPVMETKTGGDGKEFQQPVSKFVTDTHLREGMSSLPANRLRKLYKCRCECGKAKWLDKLPE